MCKKKKCPGDQSVRLAADGGVGCTYQSGKVEQSFSFDGTFSDSSTQEEVYDLVARPIVESSLRGYSGTIFAYGPTGSGKTHTMKGSISGPDRGILPRYFFPQKNYIVCDNAGVKYQNLF